MLFHFSNTFNSFYFHHTKLKFPFQGLAPFFPMPLQEAHLLLVSLKSKIIPALDHSQWGFSTLSEPISFRRSFRISIFIHVWFTGGERGQHNTARHPDCHPTWWNVFHRRQARARDSDPSPSARLTSWLPFVASASSPLEWVYVIWYFKNMYFNAI